MEPTRSKDSTEGKAVSRVTVVVEMSHSSALTPHVPTMAYVIPHEGLTEKDFASLREAAEDGGCKIRIFMMETKDLDSVQASLRRYNATELM